MVLEEPTKGNGNQTRRTFLKSAGAVGTTGLALTAGCMGSLGGDGATNLRFNIPTGKQSIQGKTPQWFKEEVEERSGGDVSIELFFNGELGGQIESFENMSSGAVDMFITGFSLAGTQYKPVQVFDTPYMYEDYEHMIEATDPEQSDVAKELIGNLVEETDIRALGSVVQGTRRLTLSDEPAYHPDDLQGRKVRAVPIDMMFEAVNGLGANAVNIDWSEVPSALSTGSVAGQENPYNIIWNAGIYESQDYLIETNHMDATLPIYISEHSWKKLSSDQQDIFTESMKAVQPVALEELNSSLDDFKQKMGEELEIIEAKDIDMPAFKSSVRGHIREQFPDWIETIEKIHGGEYK